MNKFRTNIKFIRHDKSLIYEVLDVNPLLFTSHDPDVMKRLIFPVDYGFQDDGGIICEDWVTEEHAHVFSDCIMYTYSFVMRKKCPEDYKNGKLIVNGSNYLISILMCHMLGIEQLDLYHDGSSCTYELFLLALKQGIIIQAVNHPIITLFHTEDMRDVKNIEYNPTYLMGVYLSNKDMGKICTIIPTLYMVCNAWNILNMESTTYMFTDRRDKYKKYILDEFRTICTSVVQNPTLVLVNWLYYIPRRIIDQLESESGMILPDNACASTYESHVAGAIFYADRKDLLQDRNFVRVFMDEYHCTSASIRCSYEAFEISTRILRYHVIYRYYQHKQFYWSEKTLNNLKSSIGSCDPFSDNMIALPSMRTNSIILLLNCIITHENKQYVDIDDFKRMYKRWDTIDEFILWEKGLLQEYIDAIPEHLYEQNSENTDLICMVMKQM